MRKEYLRMILGIMLSGIIVMGACSLNIINGQNSTPDPSDIKILFIGSSYFGSYDMPGMLDKLSLAGEKDVYIDQVIYPGVLIAGLAVLPGVHRKIEAEDWDYVLIQGGPTTIAYMDSSLVEGLRILCTAIRKNHSSSIPVYFMNWAFEDGMLWVEGHTETYEIMQEMIYANTLILADSLDMGVAPAGWAWNEVMKTSPPLHYLFLADYNHPSLRGVYLSACVLYVTVHQDTLFHNAYHCGLDAGEAEYFQGVANGTVWEGRHQWNLPGFPLAGK